MTRRRERSRLARLGGVVTSHADAASRIPDAGDMMVVRRGVLRSVVMRCPDGCGDVITVNLDRRLGKAWRIYLEEAGVTIFPSVWRDGGCGSHFVLWRGVFFWMDFEGITGDESSPDPELVGRVLSILKQNVFVHYVALADALGEVPWAVLSACRSLVRAGIAEESAGGEGLSFKRC